MLISRRSAIVSATALAGAALAACSTSGSKGGAKDSGGLTIVATTGYLGDAAKNIAPDATITVLVGPGGEPFSWT